MEQQKPPVILLVGSPRSGTTWLAKIFDSHRNVLYRHEPDSVLKSPGLPFVPESNELTEWTDQATSYLDKLLQVRSSKSAGSSPMFRKDYRGIVREYGRRGYINALKAMESAASRTDWKPSLDIPDWIPERKAKNLVYAIKSVDSLTRTRLFSEARPDAKIVHIIRHPCAFVASELRGEKLKLMQIDTFIDAQVRMVQATRRGLNAAQLESMSREAQLASLWMLQNEKVIEEMQDRRNYKIVVYEDLCESPLETAKELFEFCDLDWDNQTEQFIGLSLGHDSSAGGERYFQVVRDPLQAAFKWKKELSEQQISNILSAVRESLPGQLYASLAP